MKSSSHPEAPSSSSTHSYKKFSKNYRGKKPFNPQDRQESNYKRSYDDAGYSSRNYQSNRDNNGIGDYPDKRPKLKETSDRDHSAQASSARNYNHQRNYNNDGPSRPPYNSTNYERPTVLHGGSEMFYQSGRLPTGMYVNRNIAAEKLRSEENSNDAANDDSAKAATIPKSHFLLKSMHPKGKNLVALPFLQLNNTEKASTTKEPSSAKSRKPSNKAKTPSSSSSSAIIPAAASSPDEEEASTSSAKAITENAEDKRPSLEELEREFDSFQRVKQELFEDPNEGSEPQSPSIPSMEVREFETQPLRPSPPRNLNRNMDFTSDNLPFNQQFSPAPELHFPDPNIAKDAMLFELNASVANLKSKRANLMQHSKDLTSNLHRVLTEIEILDIQIDQMMYKTAALRNHQ